MKNVRAAIGVLLSVVVLAILTDVYAQPASKPPIKLGALYALTGPYTIPGTNNLEGVRLNLEKRGYKIAGRKVELIIEEEEGKPDVALMKTRKLVENDKVGLIFGPVSSASAYAMQDYLRQAKVPLMLTCAAAGALTRGGNPYYFRVWHGGGLYNAAQWAYEKMGCKKAIFTGMDYAYGRECGETFAKGFTKAGGTMQGEIFIGIGTKDFGPYITKIGKLAEDTGADCLGITFSGADAIGFITQLHEYGVKDKFRVMINFATTIARESLVKEGKAAIGHYEVCPYYKGLDNPENREFLKLLEKKYGPDKMETSVCTGYMGADVVARALEQVQGNIEDKDRFLKAMRSLRYDSIFGPFEFDPRDQNMRINFRILRCEMVGDKVDQVLVHTFTKTEDWWWGERRK